MTDTPSSETSKHVEVDVPENAYVRCPANGFDLVRAAQCATCVHFRGLADRFPGRSDMPFNRRYTSLCVAQPTQREILTVSAIDIPVTFVEGGIHFDWGSLESPTEPVAT